MTARDLKESSARGFSLIELMIVMLMITIVLAAILTQVDTVQQRATAEQGKVDDFQQARDFMAQVVRDGRAMGYPNIRDFDTSGAAPACGAWQDTAIDDCALAVGLVKLTSTELDFEGDVDGSGSVSVVSYKMNGDGLCTQCLERAQVPKITGNPLAQVAGIPTGAGSPYVQEVQNVQNADSDTDQIFSAFDASGNAVALPIDISSNPMAIAQIRLIKVNLSVASPTSVDPKTGQQLEAAIGGNVQVVNCSMATTEAQLQDAGVTVPGNLQLTCQ
ncbi:MAG TPA: type II secretion system protein [Candidatus Acidoferrum sp.]|nr:type II secretion system protein [Candidatus Acidoferrum sp.]